ncbi:MAG: glycosyltransferase [Candidatus Woesearchaeota archaeon]
MNVLFTISSLGLGHITRCIPIIDKLLEKDYRITVICHGNSLNYLKNKYNEEVNYYDFEDYPKFMRGKGDIDYIPNLIIDSKRLKNIINSERKFLDTLLENKKFDLIISDGRYGFYTKSIPSYILSHQIKILLPLALKPFEKIVMKKNIKLLKKFNKVIIPDTNQDENLSGKMSHGLMKFSRKKKFVGILSSLYNLDSNYEIENSKLKRIVDDLDFLFIMGGYLLGKKPDFIKQSEEQLKKINKKTVIVTGDVKKQRPEFLTKNVVKIPYIMGDLKKLMFKNANHIIGRTGYTTIMDLVQCNKKGYLIPTPGQTEQEYLGKYLKDEGYFYTSTQSEIDIEKYLNNVENYNPPKLHKTKKSVNNVMRIIKNEM